MPDCDYCAASFDDEDAYLEHLASEHAGELGRIDRRRVVERGAHETVNDGDSFVRYGLAISIVFIVVGAVGYAVTSGLV
ncbi:hypothetical protein AB7C87_13915 [Natrarchaeobius sp. A-rgal3]|uniref:hypothetical protein n=1 Tax=Natrarchaeobius versutus TaxID=1679078 RepID=UPI0035107F62